jgi:hypothetical protein
LSPKAHKKPSSDPLLLSEPTIKGRGNPILKQGDLKYCLFPGSGSYVSYRLERSLEEKGAVERFLSQLCWLRLFDF